MGDYAPVTPTISEPQFKTLYILHATAFALHAVQTAVLAALVDTSNSVTGSFVRYNVWDKTAAAYTQYDLSKVPLMVFPPVFIGLAALDHLLCFTLWDVWYRSALSAGVAYLRWCEYALSASLMNVDILLLSNGLDALQIIAVFALTAVCMSFGAIAESTATANQPLAIVWFSIGFVPFAAAWGIILTNFASAAPSPPPFVYAINIVIILLQLMFAVNLLFVRFSSSIPDRLYYAEIGWIVLSFFAKSILAWIQYGGSVARSSV